MAAQRWIIALISMTAISLLAGCSGGSTFNVQNPPPPPPSNVSIQFQSTPPSSVGIGSTIQFTPNVNNDPNNLGVDWAITCSNSFALQFACGTLSIMPTMHSASGTKVTYTPPAGFPAGTLTVNITVFATADPSKNILTAVSITSFANVLKGNYVFQAKGSDLNGQPYQITGTLALDGNGNITAGEQTLNTIQAFSVTVNSSQQNPSSGKNYFSGSTYFVGPDGRGALVLNNMLDPSGVAASETFTLEILSSSDALLGQLGLVTPGPPAALESFTATGTLELQDSTASATPPTGAYAFVASGSDSGASTATIDQFGPLPIGFGGVLNIDSSGTISGAGSIADEEYNRKLISCPANTGISGSVSKPDAFGSVLIELSAPMTCLDSNGNPASFDPQQLLGYIVDSTHIRLIENDDANGSGGFLSSGLAVSQGSAAGTFTNSSFSGSYVFSVLANNFPTVNNPVVTPSSFTSVGVVTPDSQAGTLSGYTDTLLLTTGSGGQYQLSSTFKTADSMTYQVDATGRVQWPGLAFGKPPNGFQPDFIYYLTGNGTAPLVLYAQRKGSLGSVGSGIAYPQAANPASLSFGNPETYGVIFTQQGGPFGAENDGTGQMSSTISGISGSLTGSIDDISNNLANGSGTASLGGFGTSPVGLADTFTLPADSFGRIGQSTFLSGNGGGYVEYYMIDDNHGFLVETDLISQSSGQVTLGYFAPACNVATGCQQAASSAKGRALKRRLQ